MDMVIPGHLKNRVFVYIDDLLTISENCDLHLSLLQEEASLLRKSVFTINMAKCKCCLTEVKHIGNVVGHGTLKTDRNKPSATGCTFKPYLFCFKYRRPPKIYKAAPYSILFNQQTVSYAKTYELLRELSSLKDGSGLLNRHDKKDSINDS